MSASGFLWRLSSTAGYVPGPDGPAVSTAAGFGVGNVITVAVQAAFGFAASAHLSEGAWTDLSKMVSVVVDAPASRNLGALTRYEASTAQVVVDNQDRRYDPANLAGPYVTAGKTQLLPMVPLRVIAHAPLDIDGILIDVGGGGGTYDIDYPLFRGYVDNWQTNYSSRAKTSQTTIRATDGTKALSRYNGPVLSPVGASETTGARVARILDNAGWDPLLRGIEDGIATVQATTFAQPAWTELLLVADSERGDIFFDGEGQLRFFQQTHRTSDARSVTAQAAWGDGPNEMPYANPSLSFDDTLIYNQIVIANAGGTQQTAEDAPSQAQFLTRSLNRTDLVLTSDGAALSYANSLLVQLKDPYLRVDGLDYSPGNRADQVAASPAVLGALPLDRWKVALTPPGGGDRIVRDVWVSGRHWEFRQATWSARFTFQPIDARVTEGFTLDSPTLGILDTDKLSY